MDLFIVEEGDHHPRSGIVWREQVVIDELRDCCGWSEQMVRDEVLMRYTADAACIGSPGFDKKSVMLYPIPAHWTTNFSSSTNHAISKRDRKCAEGLYGA